MTTKTKEKPDAQASHPRQTLRPQTPRPVSGAGGANAAARDYRPQLRRTPRAARRPREYRTGQPPPHHALAAGQTPPNRLYRRSRLSASARTREVPDEIGRAHV